MGNFDDRLNEMQKSWETGKDRVPGSVPDGIYTLKLQDAELGESQAGNLKVNVRHLVLEPAEYAGETLFDQYMLTDQGFPWTCQWIKQMGFEPPTQLRDIESKLAEMLEAPPTYTMQIKKDGDWTRFRFQRLVEGTTSPAVAHAADPNPPMPGDPTVTPAEGFKVGTAVEWSNEGRKYSGNITAIQKNGTLDVKDTHGDEWELSPAQIEGLVGEGPATQEDPVRLDLLAVAQAMGAADEAKLTDESSKDDIIKALLEYEYNAVDYTKDEVSLLKEIGADVKEPAAKKKAAKKASRKKK